MRGTSQRRRKYTGIVVLAGFFMALAVGVPSVVPLVPLRLTSVTFAAEIDQQTLRTGRVLRSEVPVTDLGRSPFVVVEVFAPSNVGTTVQLDWTRDGELVRTSGEITIVAHELGFRVWDAYSPEDGEFSPGSYQVTLRTSGHRVFGMAAIEVR